MCLTIVRSKNRCIISSMLEAEQKMNISTVTFSRKLTNGDGDAKKKELGQKNWFGEGELAHLRTNLLKRYTENQ